MNNIWISEKININLKSQFPNNFAPNPNLCYPSNPKSQIPLTEYSNLVD